MVHTKAWGLFWFPSPQKTVGMFTLWLVNSTKLFLFMSKGTQMYKQVWWLHVYFMINNQVATPVRYSFLLLQCCSPQGHLAPCPQGRNTTSPASDWLLERGRGKEKALSTHRGEAGPSSSSQTLWRHSQGRPSF